MSTIKSQIMAAIETELKKITSVKMVKRQEIFPVDLDNAPRPALYFYDDNEIKTQNPPGIAFVEMPLFVTGVLQMTPAGLTSANSPADDLHGQVEEKIFGLVNPASGLIWKIGQHRMKKQYASDAVCLVEMEFQVYYGHAWGLPSVQANV